MVFPRVLAADQDDAAWDVLAALPGTYLTARGARGVVPGERLHFDSGGSPAEAVHAIWPCGPDHVLDLVGAGTAVDSLQVARRGGTVCVAGSLSGRVIPELEPIAMIPTGTRLTAFHSRTVQGSAAVLQRIVDEVEAGRCRPNLHRVFGLDDVVAAHRCMEDDRATGKLVVVP
ncbi:MULTISPECIES: zinc-binding dehydrogenase [Amycolatopsis]|uniref:Zinc-binding dehydrogenase n=1 Tax=Amycolatopsis thermalba TaxID=944492 RepID=A0ABY4NUA8_9PSEU|nr:MULTISPECIES: zinc-binding dehydrogenase [Amycolatopsis]UQS23637.1 zinc-binding dehydrogenase [Amycolatopsis thermalba]